MGDLLQVSDREDSAVLLPVNLYGNAVLPKLEAQLMEAPGSLQRSQGGPSLGSLLGLRGRLHVGLRQGLQSAVLLRQEWQPLARRLPLSSRMLVADKTNQLPPPRPG